MKWIFLFCFLFALTPIARAHAQPPFSAYLISSENLYLVQVISVAGNKITFNVIEVLKGEPTSTLVLNPYPSGQNYIPKSEWLLASCPPHGLGKDSVGWAMKGDCAWIPCPILRNNDERFVPCSTLADSNIVLDIAPDGTKGLTLDHIKQLLKNTPPKT